MTTNRDLRHTEVVTPNTAAVSALRQSLRVDGGMVRPTKEWRLIMSVQETSEIRELTADELDFVSGGVTGHDVGFGFVVAWVTGVVAMGVSVALGAIWDAIFD
jgi:hypothetical protein